MTNKKNLIIFASAALLTCSFPLSTFAGEWKADQNRWWYQNDDGSYKHDTWFEDTNGKFYYFDKDGYMMADTLTPDGYFVGTDGAWIADKHQLGMATAGKEAAHLSLTAAYRQPGSGLSYSVPVTVYYDKELSDGHQHALITGIIEENNKPVIYYEMNNGNDLTVSVLVKDYYKNGSSVSYEDHASTRHLYSTESGRNYTKLHLKGYYDNDNQSEISKREVFLICK